MTDRGAIITGAIISAVAAVLGGVVVGFFSWRANVDAEDRRNDRIELRAERQAQGAARSMIYELRDAAFFIDLMYTDGHLYPMNPRFPISVPQEDRRLVYSLLDGEEYETLTRSFSGIATIQVYLTEEISPKRRYRRLFRGDRENFRAHINEAAEAMNALARVANLESPGDIVPVR